MCDLFLLYLLVKFLVRYEGSRLHVAVAVCYRLLSDARLLGLL